MSQQELLRRVIAVLEASGIEYMLTGSYVSSLQGEPRLSHDIDMVVAFHDHQIDSLVSAFPAPDFYLSKDSVLRAIQDKSTFNLIDVSTSDKVDFWLLTDDSFDRSRFSRRYLEEILGLRIYVSRPEDTILMKLKWSKDMGGSEKQFHDALAVYEVQRDAIDREYLEHWVKALHLDESWQRLFSEAGPPLT